jgi:branched-chain amino acid aminotransferase
MEIKKKILTDAKRQDMPSSANLSFGVHFADHMFVMKYNKEQEWHDAQIIPYKNFSLDPAATCLHYGQAIFEGLKAYQGKDGKIRLFRPMENMERFNRSAWRMCMPMVDKQFLSESIKELVRIDSSWVPADRHGAPRNRKSCQRPWNNPPGCQHINRGWGAR